MTRLSRSIGQLDGAKPSESLDPEEVRGRWPFDQVPMEHGMDLVLDPGAFKHQLGTTLHPTPGEARRLLRQPHLRKETRPE